MRKLIMLLVLAVPSLAFAGESEASHAFRRMVDPCTRLEKATELELDRVEAFVFWRAEALKADPTIATSRELFDPKHAAVPFADRLAQCDAVLARLRESYAAWFKNELLVSARAEAALGSCLEAPAPELTAEQFAQQRDRVLLTYPNVEALFATRPHGALPAGSTYAELFRACAVRLAGAGTEPVAAEANGAAARWLKACRGDRLKVLSGWGSKPPIEGSPESNVWVYASTAKLRPCSWRYTFAKDTLVSRTAEGAGCAELVPRY
jgi:hypothetical protein